MREKTPIRTLLLPDLWDVLQTTARNYNSSVPITKRAQVTEDGQPQKPKDNGS